MMPPFPSTPFRHRRPAVATRGRTANSAVDSAAAAGSDPRVLLGRYRIEKTLGRGGMGEVLLATDQLLHRRVALKRVIPQGDDRESIRRAVLREARRASRITDRHVMQIHDVVELPDEVMLVMEYVDGVTLREHMSQPVSLAEFWRLAPQCVRGLAAAHAQGVIHRDIKPENFMVTPSGEVKVLDFGIAKRSDDGVTTTTSTTGIDSRADGIAGTPQYMAPEVLLGGRVDERADIFSLGVVFYELLTSRRPFAGARFAALANEVINLAPPEVRELNPKASPALSKLIAAMLAKNPDERIATATALEKLLAEVRSDPANTTGLATGDRAVRSGGAEAAGDAMPVGHSQRHRAFPRGPATLGALAFLAAAVTLGRMMWLPALPADVNVALLPPQTPGATEDFAHFAMGAMSTVYSRLQRHADTPGFQLASFSDVVEENAKSAADARKSLGANVTLVSNLEQTPDRLRARLELHEPLRDRVIAAREIDVPAQQPFAYLDRLYRETAELLGQKPIPGDASTEVGIRGSGTLRFYLQGLGRRITAKDSNATRAAVGEFESACRTEPESAVARAGLAAALYSLQQITNDPRWLVGADSASWAAVGLDDQRAEGHRIRGAVLSLGGDPGQAVREFTRAAELRPFDDDLVLRFARAFTHAGDPAREKAVYLATIRKRPHDWRPYWWLATWERRAGNVDECIRLYEEMVRRAPQYSVGYANLGGLLVLRGDYARAIDTLTRSIELRPNLVAYSNLGTAYFNSRRLLQAIDAYNQSFQFDEADYRTWMNLGDAYYWHEGKRPQAAAAYSQALRTGREEAQGRSRRGAMEDATITANLSTLFARLGQPDSARVYLRRAIDADSTNWRVQYAAALTSWQLQDRSRAIVWLERSVRGGYPVVWLRDSPVFQEWRGIEAFRALVANPPHSEGG